VSIYADKGCACDTLDPACTCDVSDYDDKNCPCDESDNPCDCDVSDYDDKDCPCDVVDLPCDCDVSSYNDKNCPCDVVDPPCNCDNTQYDDPGCPCDNSDPENPTTTVSYSSDIQPIWDTYCVECHFSGIGGEIPVLTTGDSYDAIVPEYITTYNVAMSRIYTQVESGAMPDGSDRIPQEYIDQLLLWLQEGYNNN
jgi:hypothetical protein